MRKRAASFSFFFCARSIDVLLTSLSQQSKIRFFMLDFFDILKKREKNASQVLLFRRTLGKGVQGVTIKWVISLFCSKLLDPLDRVTFGSCAKN